MVDGEWMDILCKTMGSDFKGFLGAILLESYSVHFGYLECSFPFRTRPVYRSPLNDVTCHVFSRTTCSTWSKRIIVLHGANECHIRDDSPDLWVHRRFPCNTTYIIQLESRLCRFDVAPVRFLRSNELFRHHTPSSRSWK